MNLLSGDTLFTGVCAGDYTISLSDANGCASELLVGGNDQQIIDAFAIFIESIYYQVHRHFRHSIFVELSHGMSRSLFLWTSQKSWCR